MEKKKVQELSLEMMDKVTGGLAGNDPRIQTDNCPYCGQPVAFSVIITGGNCPHCGMPIHAER